MILRYSPTSPYVRKVTITAHETGLTDRIELVPANVWSPETDIAADNPLGKVPALVTDGGERLFDSPVICEYLDSLHGGVKLFPATGGARWTALRRQALADGIVDAGAAIRVETAIRPKEAVWPKWIDRQKAAIGRALDSLEDDASGLAGQFTIGEITIVCALGFLDFRLSDIVDWRAGRPSLAAWYASVSERPSVKATMPHD